MPPSLHILKRLHLDRAFVDSGVRVDTAVVHNGQDVLGQVRFCGLRGGYPFILSLPQAQTVRLLKEHLKGFPSVRYCDGTAVVGLMQSERAVSVQLRHERAVRASVVVGCDGIYSTVRELVKIRSVERPYECSFLMGDFEDQSGLDDEAHLFFTSKGSVESFPLPNQQRRWIVQTHSYRPDIGADFLVERVAALSGIDVRDSKQLWQSAFRPWRMVCRQYSCGRVVLCGDAAHVMSPIGGQGMNTGFADAALLAQVLVAALRRGASHRSLIAQYAYYRRRAFRKAMRRAEWGMWFGTRTGRCMSGLRSVVIKHGLLRRPLIDRLPAHFAMSSIPFHGLDLEGHEK